MAIIFDAIGAGASVGQGVAATAEAHTLSSSANCLLVWGNSNTLVNPDTPTCVCGSTPMTLVGTVAFYNSGGVFDQGCLFGLMNPPTGAQTITFTRGSGGSFTGITFNSISYIGVGSIGTAVSVTGGPSTSLAQNSVASATGNLLTQAFFGNTNALASAYNQTSQWNVVGAGNFSNCVTFGDAAGAATVSFTETNGGNPTWGGLAVNLLPSLGVPAPSPMMRIPNRNVGPMALRRKFRQVLQQTYSTAVDVTISPAGIVSTESLGAPAILSPVTRNATTGNLMLNGQRYRFSGANAFNDVGLTSTSNGNAYGGVDVSGNYLVTHSQIDALLKSAQALNVSVIRCFGAVMSAGVSNSLQPTLGSFNATALENVDYFLSQCALKGFKVVFPLTDNYNFTAIGGKYWYLSANGITPDADATQFFTNTTVITQFKAQISYVLSHVNQYTGIAYKDDPTVLAWETGNELTGIGLSAATFAGWTDTISQYIKLTLSAVQLVMDGKIGITSDLVTFDTASLALVYTDIYSDHTYDNFRTPQWEAVSAAVAHTYGKAFCIGEYTWTDKNTSGTLLNWYFTEMLSRIEGDTNLDGDAIFDLLAPLTSWGDGFTLHSPGDDANMTARGSQLAAHCTAMSSAVPQTITIQDQAVANTTSNTVSLTFNGNKWTPKAGDVVAIWTTVVGSTGIALPGGWVNPLGGSTVVAYGSSTYWVAYHLVTSAEQTAGTLTYTMSSVMGSFAFSAAGLVLRGVDNSNVVDAVASTFNSSSGTTHVLPGVTGLLDGSLIFSGVAKQGTGSYTQSDRWGRATWVETTQTQWVMQLDTRGVAGGSTSSTNITSTNSVPYAAISVAFSGGQTQTISPAGIQSAETFGTPLGSPVLMSVGTVLGGGTSTTANVAVPAGVQANDIIVIWFYVQISQTVTPPAGFTEAPDSPNIVTGLYYQRMYWKRATGNDTGTYNFTIASGLTWRNAQAFRFSGCVTSGNPFDVTAVSATSSAVTSIPAVSDTSTVPRTLWILMGLTEQAGVTMTTASGFAEQLNTSAISTTFATKTQVIPNSSGSLVITMNSPTAASAWLGALIPVPLVTNITITPAGIGTSETLGAPTAGATNTISPAGIPTAERLGAPAVSTTATISPIGIGTSETVGAPAVSTTATISPAGIGTSETLGAPAVSATATISTAGIGTSETVGAPVVSITVTISPAGTGTSETFGAPSVSATATISLAGVGSSQTVGAPAVSATATISPAGVGSSETVGAPSVSATATISPIGIGSSETIGVPSVTRVVTPVGVGTAEVFGAPAASSVDAIAPVGISSGESLGSPNVSATSTISPVGIGTGEAIGGPQVAAGAVTVAPAGVGTGEAFGGPLVGQTSTISPAGIGTVETVGAPSVTTTSADQSGGGIPTAEVVGAPNVTQVITPVGIGTSETVGAPGLTRIVAPSGIGTLETVGASTVTITTTITPAGIPTGEQFGCATVTPGVVTVAPAGVGTSETLGAPNTGVGVSFINPAGIGTSETVGAPAVSAVDTISLTGIGSSETVGAPNVTVVASPASIRTVEMVGTPNVTQIVTPAGIGSSETVGAPTVTITTTITPAGVGTSEQFGSATVTPGAVTVTSVGVGTSEAIGSPNVSVGASFITPLGIGSSETVGAPVVNATATVTPTGVGTGQVVGNASLTQTVSPAGIGSNETCGASTVLANVSPAGIETSQQVGSPTLLLSQTISPSGIVSGEGSGSSTITPGTVTVAPNSIGTEQRSGIVVAANALMPSGIPGVEMFGNPMVSTFSPPGSVIASGISSMAAVGYPVVRFPPGGDRTLQVAADSRTMTPGVRERVYTVTADGRTTTRPADSRTLIVPPERT